MVYYSVMSAVFVALELHVCVEMEVNKSGMTSNLGAACFHITDFCNDWRRKNKTAGCISCVFFFFFFTTADLSKAVKSALEVLYIAA